MNMKTLNGFMMNRCTIKDSCAFHFCDKLTCCQRHAVRPNSDGGLESGRPIGDDGGQSAELWFYLKVSFLSLEKMIFKSLKLKRGEKIRLFSCYFYHAPSNRIIRNNYFMSRNEPDPILNHYYYSMISFKIGLVSLGLIGLVRLGQSMYLITQFRPSPYSPLRKIYNLDPRLKVYDRISK